MENNKKSQPLLWMLASTFICFASFPLSFILQDGGFMCLLIPIAAGVLAIGLATGKVKTLG